MLTIFVFISVNSFGQVEVKEEESLKSETLSNVVLKEFPKAVDLDKKKSLGGKVNSHVKLTAEEKAIRYKEELPTCVREAKISLKTL